MIKRILVPTDGSDDAKIGIDYAVALAKRVDATLQGIHVVDIKLLEGPFLRDISASLGTAPYVNYQGNISMVLQERGKAALQVLENASQTANVPCETILTSGIVAKTLVENSQLTDLIVMGRGGEHSQWLDGLLGSTTEAVVRGASAPVLVTNVKTPKLGQFLAAYDGSHYAKRALQTCVDIAEAWQVDFHVLVVGKKKADERIAEAKAYLDTHDITTEFIVREGDPSEEIVAYAGDYEADLIVMGAYGHTKVRELVVGSTTTYTLNHAPCPVLLSR